MQIYWIGSGNAARQICLPAADSEIVEGVCWGRADALDTPAYWALRCAVETDPLHGFKSSSGSLIEEIGFCLLGGFGITAELNSAAFMRLRHADVFDLEMDISEDDIRELLLKPLAIAGRTRRYRFPNQRARRLAAMRKSLAGTELQTMPLSWINQALRKLPGIGPKTAAWIMRNHFGSDDVAILDVHVIRACGRLRIFPPEVVVPRDYHDLEARFLDFARAMGVKPSVLDAVMWIDMRTEPKSLRRLAA